MPKLNYEESEKLVEYILNIARRWISPPFSVDGWRLDVAADLGNTGQYNHEFWRRFRQAVKEVNPEVLILAEHYGDPSSWLAGDQWDSVMNYDAFMEPVTWFLTGMEKHSDSHNSGICGDGKSFFDAMAYHMSRMQTGSLLTAMNEPVQPRSFPLPDQDQPQGGEAGHRRGPDGPGRGKDQCDARGGDDPDDLARSAYHLLRGRGRSMRLDGPGQPADLSLGEEDLELLEYHRYMIGIHKRLSVVSAKREREASFGGPGCDRLRAMYKKYHAVPVINNGETERCLEIPVWQLGITDDVPVAG